MKNKYSLYHQAAVIGVIYPPLPQAQCMSHLPQRERQHLWQPNLAPNVGLMVCGHQLTILPSNITISWHRILPSNWLPKSYKINFSHWETACKCMTFPRHPTAQLQAAECSDSIHGHYQYELWLCTKERTLPNLPTWDMEVHGEQSSVFPGRTMVRGWISKKETHPRRTATPKPKRCSPIHSQGFKQICSFVNSVHQVSNSKNAPRCQGYVTFLSARDTRHSVSARGMNLCLKLWDHTISVRTYQVRSG